MPNLLLLVGDPAKARNDNHQRFAAGFERAGWQVTVEDHEALEVRANKLVVAGRDPGFYDLIWPLGFGRQISFLDRMQLLKGLNNRKFVTSPDVLLYLHGKHRWLDAMPETHTSCDTDYLFAVITGGGDWIVKPTAGSYGRDVHLVREGQATLAELVHLAAATDNGYLMAQRFVPEIAAGEKRTLIAGGRMIGSYLRRPEDGVSSNLATAGRAEETCLTDAERVLIEPIARELADLGAGFAAIDTVYPYLMEVNVVNPGGLETIETVEGRDRTDLAVESIIAWQQI